MTMRRIVACVVLVVASSQVLQAADCGFAWVNPLPPRVDLHRVFESGGLYVAVGARGTIATSRDGAFWQLRDSGTTADLFGGDWGEGVFVVVGDGVVLSSSDGTRWTTRWREDGVLLEDVDYGDGRFLAVGTGLGPQPLVSDLGLHWQRGDEAWDGTAHSVVWARDRFVVAASSGSYSSEDGLVWVHEGGPPAEDRRLRSKAGLPRLDLGWDGSRLFWVEGLWVFTSEDGASWALAFELDSCEPFAALSGVWAEPGLVMVAGAAACPDPFINPDSYIVVSTDGGEQWETVLKSLGGGINSLVRRGSRYVAVGGGGELRTAASVDGWECVEGACNAEGCKEGFFGLAQGDETWVAAGGVGGCESPTKHRFRAQVATSGDGRTWQLRDVDADPLRDVVADPAGFVAVGDSFSLFSSDGEHWQEAELPLAAQLEAVAHGGGVTVAVGERGTIVATDNGVDWNRWNSFTERRLFGIAWTGGAFVAVGERGAVLWSADGFHWHDTVSLSSRDLYGIGASDARVYVAGGGGALFSSHDLQTWEREYTGVDGSLRDLSWNGELLFAVGAEPGSDEEPGRAVVLASADGRHWTRLASPGFDLRSVVAQEGEVLASGGARSLVRATCLPVLVTLDPPHRELLVGDTLQLTLSLSEALGSAQELQLVSSHPQALSVPSSLTMPAGQRSLRFELEGAALVEEALVTVSLTTAQGTVQATSTIDVVPPLPQPRRVNGRRAP